MRILALDIGEKRTGLAITDEEQIISQPFDYTVEAKDIVKTIKNLQSEQEIGLILVGLPTSMSGFEGPQAAIIKEIGQNIEKQTLIPVKFIDERLTTKQAEYFKKDSPGTPIDCLVAQLLLEEYLRKNK